MRSLRTVLYFAVVTLFVLSLSACSPPVKAPVAEAEVSLPAPSQSASIPAQAPQAARMAAQIPDTARYGHYVDNAVQQVSKEPLSTFGLDVDTASYANVRRFLNAGKMPHPDAVRAEEMLNYFPWSGQELALKPLSQAGGHTSPFAAAYELAPSPWSPDKILLSLTLKAREQKKADRPPSNLVFLVDVSGSMNTPESLPLVKSTLRMLVNTLRRQDRISVVTYSGSTGVALKATPGDEKAEILSVIDNLQAGGSTAGASGLALAYEQAEQNFIKGGVNRILLCTDGDFNLGVTSDEELTAMVTRNRDKGVTLSALGYGTYNLNDSMMVKIADNGNGNYSYIDSLSEAKKVLGAEMQATLVTVAKDAKAQVEFNPAAVLEYRQIGYEKRQLRAEDFNNDAVDAGDIGAGKQVTVLYELTLAGGKASVDALRYGRPAVALAPKAPAENAQDATGSNSASATGRDELAFVKLRWKERGSESSALAELPIRVSALASSFDKAGAHLRFSAAVAAYAQKLRNNPHLSKTAWADIAAWAEAAKGSDPGGYRSEFVKLVGLAETLAR